MVYTRGALLNCDQVGVFRQSLLLLRCRQRDVQDAILQDPELRKVVDIIHIEQWYYTQKGLYAPEGGKNLAPRQYQRRLRPGKVTYDDVFKSVSEYRQTYPEKAVIYSGASAPENGKAVMDAGGSCPNVK